MYIPSYFSCFIILLGYAFLVVFGVLLEEFSAKVGLTDIFFTLLIIPTLLELSKIIMFDDYTLSSLAKFAPLNFQFLTLCATNGAEQSLKKKETPSSTQATPSKSLFDILGKNDTFRGIVVIYLYYFAHMIYDSFSKKSLT